MSDANQSYQRPQSRSELVFTALGAASTCWENIGSAGVFNSTRAKEIGDQLLEDLASPSLDGFSDDDKLALLRFTEPNFAVKDARQEAVIELRRHFFVAARELVLAAPHSKSRAVALTELETAMMWAVKAFFGAPGENR